MSNQIPKLVISGASGQLGGRVAELVAERGLTRQLILVSRDPESLIEFKRRGADIRYGDFSDPRTLFEAYAGGSRMLLVSIDTLENRAELHGAAIDAAATAGIRQVIYTSGLSPEPPNPAVVAPSHYETEQRLASCDIGWTILRNSLYAEYQVPEAQQAVRLGKLVHNRDNGRVAYVSRDDCAAVAAAVLINGGHENRVFDVTGPDSYGASDLASLYSELSGMPVVEESLDDASFIASVIGDATGDDHLKYGAELVASFGKSIRSGYMESQSETVFELTGHPAKPLRDVIIGAGIW